MANLFPKWSNMMPIQLLVVFVVIGVLGVMGVAYYFTPKYTRVGYMPYQPVEYSHYLHVTQLGLDCRYCHSGIESSGYSNIPNVQTCMNCHTQIKSDSSKLAALYEHWRTSAPFQWVRIHKTPDYVYFNHSVHVNRGVSCVECHGKINHMETVWHDQPQSMAWCLDCHRDPQKKIRPISKVYDLDWKLSGDYGKKIVEDWHIQPPTTCEGCHR